MDTYTLTEIFEDGSMQKTDFIREDEARQALETARCYEGLVRRQSIVLNRHIEKIETLAAIQYTLAERSVDHE